MRLTFYGGVGSVTGANYLLEVCDPSAGSGSTKILVDCGLFQGSNYAEQKNFEKFPYDPKDISAVFVTHSHLDHIGRIPKLYKDGFRGTVYSTPAAKDFSELLLLDSERILEREAERERREPICNVSDVNSVMRLWQKKDYHEVIEIGAFSARGGSAPGGRAEFFDAGHILGSAFVRIEAEGKSVVFSGDLGNSPAPIIKPTERIENADYCIIESTYGDRVHKNIDRRREDLEDVIEDTVKKGGTLLIPAFAMERTQELLYHMDQLFEEGRVPRVPVFIDSPLAIKLTYVYKKYEEYFNKDTAAIASKGEDILNFPQLRFTMSTEQSKQINNVRPPKVIVAGSGMSQGGRILHHEKLYLSDPKNTILFIGYQAQGSLGRQILDGAEEVKIFGEEIPVRCRKVNIPGYSAHADQNLLLSWLYPMRKSLKKVFVVQGEEAAGKALAQKMRDELAVAAEIPEIGKPIEL